MAEQTETADAIAGLNEMHIVTLRWDPSVGRLIIDLDELDGFSAVGVLRLALRRVEDDLDEAVFEDEVAGLEDDDDDEGAT